MVKVKCVFHEEDVMETRPSWCPLTRNFIHHLRLAGVLPDGCEPKFIYPFCKD